MTYSLTTGQWFLPIHTTVRARFVVFCFPYAGGGTSVFRHWPQFLSPDIVACPIQLPGREARIKEAPCVSVPVLVAAVAEAIAAQCSLPFAFFGHSMGAFLSLEVAHYLRTHYQLEPVHLFVSGQRAPHLAPRIPYPSATLTDAELIEKLRQLGGTPEAILSNALLMRLVLPALRADLALSSSYRSAVDAPLLCPISAFGGNDDIQTAYADLEAWKGYTTGPFRIQMWEGGHFFLHQEQEEILSIIRQEILVSD